MNFTQCFQIHFFMEIPEGEIQIRKRLTFPRSPPERGKTSGKKWNILEIDLEEMFTPFFLSPNVCV